MLPSSAKGGRRPPRISHSQGLDAIPLAFSRVSAKSDAKILFTDRRRSAFARQAILRCSAARIMVLGEGPRQGAARCESQRNLRIFRRL